MPGSAVVYFAVYLGLTRGLPEESTLFPRAIIAVAAVLAVAIVVTEVRRHRAEALGLGNGGTIAGDDAEAGGARPWLLLAATGAFVLAFAVIGFLVAAAAFLMATMVLLGVPAVRATIIAAVLTAGYYLLFAKLLLVPL